MEKFIKDNIVVFLIPIVVAVGLIFFGYKCFTEMNEFSEQVRNNEASLQTKQQKLQQLQAQKKQREEEEKRQAENKNTSQSGKVIYEVLGQQFSPEASFGIMFENLLANIVNNGIKIRSIEYNYQPTEDKILLANAPGYNACELSFTTVGTYSQLQGFFKSIVKENYISNIYEIYIEPYERDKTILIAKFKVRLYTKTI